jgi:3-(3-hydroxy-phenyl)propionate hydroxylase
MKFVPGLRRKVIDSRTPALSGSPFVRTSWTPRQLAGKLCPNPVLADGRRLDSILGGGFALISTSPPPDTLRSALEERGTAVHIAVPGCEIADWLHRSHATSAIVRPDRTVMCAGRDMRKICDLLPTFRSDSRIRSNV